MLEYWKFKWRDVHLYHPECSRRICVKFKNPSPFCGIFKEIHQHLLNEGQITEKNESIQNLEILKEN